MQKSEERLQLAYIFTTNVMNPHHSLSKKRIVIMNSFFWFFYLLNIHDILCLYHLSIGEVNVNIFFKWCQLQYLFTPTFLKVTRKNIKKWWAISSINPNDLESPYKLHFSHHNALKLIRMINFSHHSCFSYSQHSFGNFFHVTSMDNYTCIVKELKMEFYLKIVKQEYN